MAKRKAASTKAKNSGTDSNLEPRVVALAAQLGTFLGRLQKKADGLIGNAEIRRQVSQIRDGAEDLMNQVNEAGASLRKSVAKTAPPAKKAKAKSAKTTKGRSGGVVDAPGKRHRKPPPQELFDPRLGEPMGKQMGQKSLKRRGRG